MPRHEWQVWTRRREPHGVWKKQSVIQEPERNRDRHFRPQGGWRLRLQTCHSWWAPYAGALPQHQTPMHKRTQLRLTDSRGMPITAKHHTRTPRPKTNRRRRSWNRTLQVVAVFLALGDLTALAFAPGLHVTKVRVHGTQMLTPDQVFAEAEVPDNTNVFWMLRQPLTKRLAADPMIDHAERSIRLPDTLILTVTERQPYVVLSSEGQSWLLDRNGVPYRPLDAPLSGLPVIEVAASALPPVIKLGKPLGTVWLPDAYRLLALTHADPKWQAAKIVVDQNLNLCLNSRKHPQVRLGQANSLPWKMALASAALSAYGGALSARAAYIDVSCPQQPVWRPRPAASDKLPE